MEMSTAINTYTIIGVDLFSIKVKTVDLLWAFICTQHTLVSWLRKSKQIYLVIEDRFLGIYVIASI